MMITSEVVLKGKLSFLDLGELLQMLGNAGSTGILRMIRAEGENTGHVYIVDGNPVDAEFQDRKGLEALNQFFGWLDGTFEFYSEKILRRKTILKNRMEVILDGLRLLDDGLIETLGESATRSTGTKTDNTSGIPVIKGPLVDYLYIVDEDEFSKGQTIVAQEKFGNWLWVILEGTVEVRRVLPEGQVPVNKLTEGAFIGAVSALSRKSYVRSATVTAVTDVQLGVLDFHRIMEDYVRLSGPLQEILASIENRLVQVTTGCARAYLKNDRLIQNIDGLKRIALQGNGNDRIHQIKKGQAVVVKPADKQHVFLCRLKPGDFIGEIPFLSTFHEPHAAEVYASEDLEAVPLDLIDLKEEFDEMSLTLKNIVLHTANCLSVTTGRLMDILKIDRSSE